MTGAFLQQLIGLVSKSFLHHNPRSGRLEFHEMLRQYAQEEHRSTPQANQSAQEAHAAYYANFMEERWQQLKGERQLPALAEIEADLENVRAAWNHYQDPFNTSQTWKFMYSFWFVHWARGWYLVGSQLFSGSAQPRQGQQDEALRALAVALQAYFIAWLDLSTEGYQLAEQSVRTLQQMDYPQAYLLALDSLIVNAYFQDRWE